MKKAFLSLAAFLLTTAAAQAQSLSGKIVFSVPGSGTTASSDSIFAMNGDGTGLTFLTKGCYPRLSPDGAVVAYLSGTRSPRTINDIWWRESAGGSTYEYLNNGSQYQVLGYDFTSTMHQFFYEQDHQFYHMDTYAPNGGAGLLGGGAGDLTDEFLRVNPADSSWASHNEYSGGLYVTPWTGGASPVENTHHGDISPCWSADGQWLYYGHQHDTTHYTYKMRNIYRIHPDGTGKTAITNLPNKDTLGMAICVTSDNKWIVATGRIHDTVGIWKFRVPAAGQQPDTAGYLIRRFAHLKKLDNFWLGSVDTVAALPTGIGQALTAPVGRIYPNSVAADDVVRLSLTAPVQGMTLINAQGQVAASFTGDFRAGVHALRVPAGLPAGLYILRGTAQSGPFAMRLMVAE